MGKILSGKRHGVILAAALFLSAVLMAGCGGEKEEAKVRDLEFTVVGQNEVPQELQEIIEQKKKEPFRLTYSGGEDLYIAAGYGEQKTGGYSIAVPELYLTRIPSRSEQSSKGLRSRSRRVRNAHIRLLW